MKKSLLLYQTFVFVRHVETAVQSKYIEPLLHKWFCFKFFFFLTFMNVKFCLTHQYYKVVLLISINYNNEFNSKLLTKNKLLNYNS